MQMAWRERNTQARIKAAQEALDKNEEYVLYISHTIPLKTLYLLLVFVWDYYSFSL